MGFLRSIAGLLSSGLLKVLNIFAPLLMDKLWGAVISWYKEKKRKEEQAKIDADNLERDQEAMQQGSVDDIAQSSIDLLNGNKRP